jgi:hypothetical protein
MATKIAEPNAECHSETHTEHLCYIISQGFHLTEEHEYRALVENPEYRCDRCGRRARSDGNLCVPVPL